MHKALAKLVFLIAFVFLALLLTSCELPWGTETPTELPPELTQPPLLETEAVPTPECAVVGDPEILPTIGTRLRWMDNSYFLYIPEGEFIMGAPSDEPQDYNPQHVVFLDDFWMQEAEVTNQQYAACVEAGACTVPYEEADAPYPYAEPAFASNPVVGVDWQQADAYCAWIEARLPTEAEWEKVARGPDGSPYPWGVDEPACELLNYADCLDPSAPADILSYEDGQSLYKVWDLAGNVFEWVNDWYQQDYYFASPAINPAGPAEGTERVYRGGSYQSELEDMPAWMRFNLKPEQHTEELGFRCALEGPEIKCNTLTSTNITIPPPPCQVPAVNTSQPEAQPTFTPFPPCGLANVTAFCELRKGYPVSGINISISNCFDNLLTDILGNGTALNCTVSNTNPPVYSCDPPPGSAQGSTVNISYCHELPQLQIHPECPAGYEYNFDNSFCEPIGPWLPEPPCPSGYVEDENFGCLPRPFFGCPAGFFLASDKCIPLDLCLWPDFGPCGEPVCSEGEVYDPENECCVVPEKLKAVCPAGLAYDEELKICLMPDLFGQNCYNTVITLPFCPTPTPTPTIPPPEIDCTNFTDAGECRNNGCEWIPYYTHPGGYCTP